MDWTPVTGCFGKHSFPVATRNGGLLGHTLLTALGIVISYLRDLVPPLPQRLPLFSTGIILPWQHRIHHVLPPYRLSAWDQ
jgi:hypothetical protein